MKRLVIPVRDGSKSIPKKNEQRIGNRSLLEWSIEKCLNTDVDEIIVSLNGDGLESIAKRFPVQVHYRSEETASDFATTESVILEVIKDFEIAPEKKSVIGFVQATSPFLRSESIDKCLSLAIDGKVGFTATEENAFVWQFEDQEWKPVGHPSHFRPARQQRNRQVIETGGCYAFPITSFFQNGYRFCASPIPVLVSQIESIDIDNPDDLEYARTIYNTFHREVSNSRFNEIKIIFCDFDGCLTDNKVFTNEFGHESVISNRSDGLYIRKLIEQEIEVIVLSTEKNPVVQHRADKLGIQAVTGVKSKVSAAGRLLEDRNLDWSKACFIGNDINDLEIMKICGVSMCPSDAVELITRTADIVLPQRGGEGIFRSVLHYFEGVK